MIQFTKQKLITYSIFTGLCALALFFAAPNSKAAPSDPITDLPTPNGDVNSVIVSGDTLYLGGDFTHVGSHVGSSALLDRTTGNTSSNLLPETDGIVLKAVPDGSGGWYLGGDFSTVGGITRNNIAHTNSDGSVDSAFNPNADDIVNDLILSGTNLYVAGDYRHISGTSREFLVALNKTTGTVTAWNPDSDAAITDLVLSGTTLYACGNFEEIGGQTREFLAALDTTINTNNATAWNPAPDNIVSRLVISGTTLYVSGNFSDIGGQPRNQIAALDTTINTNNATAWDPGVNNAINEMVVDGTILYAVGLFTDIGGQPRNHVAALDTTINTNNATAWDPNALNDPFSSSASSIVISGATVYIGGNFTTVGGQPHRHIAAVNKATGAPVAIWPASGIEFGIVSSLALNGADIFVGANLAFTDAVARNNLVAINLLTRTVDSLNVTFDAPVRSLAIDNDNIYVGGGFTTVDAQPRNFLAAIDLSGGGLTSWNPDPDGLPYKMQVVGTTLYAAGTFTNIGGQPRNFIAALDTTINTNNATAWDPNADGAIVTFAINGNTLYAAGAFANVGGQPRNFIAALDTTINTNNATAWDPNADGPISNMAISDTNVYAAGFFTNIGEQNRNTLASLDIDTGLATDWAPEISANPFAGMFVKDNIFFISGEFTEINSQPRQGLAALDATTGDLHSWSPSFRFFPAQNQTDNEIALHDSTVFFGASGIPESLNVFTFPKVQFTSATSSSAESAGTVNIPVSIDFIADEDVVVDYSVTGGTATGGGVDYTLASGSLTISAGSTSADITVAIVNDTAVEASETIIVTISSPQNAFFDTNTSHTLTITDNDVAEEGNTGMSGIRIHIPTSDESTSLAFQNIRLVKQGETFYIIANNMRLGVTTPEILFSYGLGFEDAKIATPADLEIMNLKNLAPADGSVVASPGDKTVYLISEGHRFPFVSGEVFTGFGYNFSQVFEVSSQELADLIIGAPITSASQAHYTGTYINLDGTIFRIANDHTRRGIPDLTVWNSLNKDFNFSNVVAGNLFDTYLPQGPLLMARVLQ